MSGMSDRSESPVPRIHRLPPGLANQIAAGEVIERPASVVKELLENSLDAGARQLEIELEAGGARLIRVRDDGCGIHPQDLKVALDRHATSKLRCPEDLQRMRTLGFRGEALPSIAAVSRFRLCSRSADAEQAYQVQMIDGVLGEVVPAAHPPGTMVEIHDLFFSVPARRKFLRTDRTELLRIRETVRGLAFSCPQISLLLRHEGKILHRLASTSLQQRVQALLGASFLEGARKVELGAGQMRLSGWLGSSQQARSQSDRQFFFLNGRMIRNRQLTHAVRVASQESLPEGRFPSYLLFLEMDPGNVDVNVHPTKQEVRFRHARDVHDFVCAGLHQLLHGSGTLFTASAPVRVSPRPSAAQVRETLSHYQGLMKPGNDRPVRAPRSAPTGIPADSPALIGGRFLALVQTDALLLIDVPVARRLLLRAQLRTARDAAAEPARRPLLIPARQAVNARQLQGLQQCRESLAALGVDLDLGGPDFVILRELPALLGEVDGDRLLQGLLPFLAALPAAVGGAAERLLDVLAEHGCQASQAPPPGAQELERGLRELGPAGRSACRSFAPGSLARLIEKGVPA